MKRFYIFTLFVLSYIFCSAQYTVYANLKNLLLQQGDTLESMHVEKRTKNMITLQGGADYKIYHPTNKSLSSYLKRKPFAVCTDSNLYINCKKMRYKKLRFGQWYAPAFIMGGNIYFSAMPLGSVVAKSSYSMGSNLGGSLGEAIASSGLVSKRVYYEINGITGEILFVSKDRMLELLTDYPEWTQSFLTEDSESARVTGKYLKLLCEEIE